MKKIKITDSFNRDILSEGRNKGPGYAFLKSPRVFKNGNKRYATVQAFSACKDYLNDVVFVEENQKEMPKIYGFKPKLTGFMKNKSYVYLGVKMLNYNVKASCTTLAVSLGSTAKPNQPSWSQFEESEETLINNYRNLLRAINKMEDHVNLTKKRTTIELSDNKELILRIPRIWAKKTFYISFLGLYIRGFYNITPLELKKPFKKMITEHIENLPMKEDKYMYDKLYKFLFEITNHKKLNKVVFPEPGCSKYQIHNGGVSSFMSLNRKLVC